MNIPRSTFYKRPDAACETARERTDADLRVRIEDILAEFPAYGISTGYARAPETRPGSQSQASRSGHA